MRWNFRMSQIHHIRRRLREMKPRLCIKRANQSKNTTNSSNEWNWESVYADAKDDKSSLAQPMFILTKLLKIFVWKKYGTEKENTTNKQYWTKSEQTKIQFANSFKMIIWVFVSTHSSLLEFCKQCLHILFCHFSKLERHFNVGPNILADTNSFITKTIKWEISQCF